jgi:hypothetical protein
MGGLPARNAPAAARVTTAGKRSAPCLLNASSAVRLRGAAVVRLRR